MPDLNLLAVLAATVAAFILSSTYLAREAARGGADRERLAIEVG
jgi:hypothetical protein